MEEIISVLVIEDDPLWAAELSEMLDDLGFMVAGVANDMDQAVSLMMDVPFDIAIVDIHINGQKSGLIVGKLLHEAYNKPFIFLTGSSSAHTIEETVASFPSAYLVKPPSRVSLYISIQQALHQYLAQQKNGPAHGTQEKNDGFFVKQGTRLKKVEWNSVISLSAQGKYAKINSVNSESYLIRHSLQNILDNVIPEELKNGFLQINRSEIINIRIIEEIQNRDIKTPYGTFYIGEAFYKSVKARINLLK